MKRVCIIAGEASGDLHGASLVKALKERGEPIQFVGLGGPLLQALDVEMVYPPPLNVVGFTEVFFKISHLFKAYQEVKKVLRTKKPDLLILIDYPDMNLRLAKAARKAGVPVLFYISPQVWAWRAGRVKTIARFVNRMAVILPFEVAFYQARGVSVEFVGHPLMDRLKMKASESPGDGPKFQPELSGTETIIGLLPGSRPTEIKGILPVLMETAVLLTQRYGPKVRFVLPVANTISSEMIREQLRPYQDQGVSVTVFTGDSFDILKKCHQAIVASGTVTLESAILGLPIQIVYKVSPVNYWIAKRLIDIPYVGLVNWVAGEKVIPEYIQDEATPTSIMQGAVKYLEDPDFTQRIREKLFEVRQRLGEPGASQRVARMAWEMMH
ncbi:MAG TPA: lipid-A-disaccharide synthase [Thermodesulfobacteriota bacterium]|nr:lipid-A-disaccharide synthase [Thermodesulfobacteriota bacterium]